MGYSVDFHRDRSPFVELSGIATGWRTQVDAIWMVRLTELFCTQDGSIAVTPRGRIRLVYHSSMWPWRLPREVSLLALKSLVSPWWPESRCCALGWPIPLQRRWVWFFIVWVSRAAGRLFEFRSQLCYVALWPWRSCLTSVSVSIKWR